jgi:hypothetical protein
MPVVLGSLVEDLATIAMPKTDQLPAPDLVLDYDTTDVEFDDAPSAGYEESIDVDYEMPADPDYDDSVHPDYALEIADPDYEEVVEEREAAEPQLQLVAASRSAFAYEVGWAVVPLAQQQPYPVVWRGHLKERHPTTGLLQRVPVYRLADGHWDCYREEELQAA